MPTTSRGYDKVLGGEEARAYLKTRLAATLDLINADVLLALGLGQNLLTNPGFEVWQRGAGPFTALSAYGPDRWQISLAGSSTLSVARNTANVDTGSQYCAACTYVHNAESHFFQKLEDSIQLRGRTVTFSVRVRCSTATAVRIAVYDPVNSWRYSSFHTGGGAYETLTVTAAFAAAATLTQVAVIFDASCTAYVDNATLCVGSVAMTYAPLHPADDLSRCLRYYEALGGGHANEQFAMLQAYSTTHANGALAFKAPKAITPTVTFSAASTHSVQNAAAAQLAGTAIAAAWASARSCNVDVTVASGLVAGNAALWLANNTLTALVALEANP